MCDDLSPTTLSGPMYIGLLTEERDSSGNGDGICSYTAGGE